MATAVRTIRIIRAALLVSIVIYLLLGEGMIHAHDQIPDRTFFYGLTGVAIAMVLVTFAVRRLIIASTEAKLALDSEDEHVMHRWRGGYIASYAFSEAIALLGFVLRVSGFGLTQVAPFYVAGFFLLLVFRPRMLTPETSALDVATR
jgi:hypothetical protein